MSEELPTPPAPGSAIEIKAPTLLVALPQVLDPFFHKSVVLLVAHEDGGSLGFVINRTTDLPVAKILEGMDMPWQGPAAARALLGGPVQQQLGSVLYAVAEASAQSIELERGAEITRGVAITQHAADLLRLAQNPPPSFRLILGYAGWEAGQLVTEIVRNDWLVAPVDPALIFTVDPSAAWERAMRSLGVDPAALPAWTDADAEMEAN